jgi:hypothetical protein
MGVPLGLSIFNRSNGKQENKHQGIACDTSQSDRREKGEETTARNIAQDGFGIHRGAPLVRVLCERVGNLNEHLGGER